MGCIAQSGYFLCQDVYISDSDYSGMDPFQGLCLCKLQGKTQSNTKMHDSHRDHKVCRWNHSQVEPAVILFLGAKCTRVAIICIPFQTSSIVPTCSHATNWWHLFCRSLHHLYDLWVVRQENLLGEFQGHVSHTGIIILFIILLWQCCILVVDATMQSCWVHGDETPQSLKTWTN